MKQDNVDIVVAGAGLSGLIATAAFASQGYSILLIDPSEIVVDKHAKGADLRTTAFLQPAQNLLARIGVWDDLSTHAMALKTMRIVEASKRANQAPYIADFNASDVSEQPFGWNLPNWLLRRELLKRLNTFENVEYCARTGFVSSLRGEETVRVMLSDGREVGCRLLIGADGRQSRVRQDAKISARTISYGQSAVTFAVTHAQPHNNISTEVHQSGGPFTLVPLLDFESRPCSAVVWMEEDIRAKKLMNLDEDSFIKQASERSAMINGALELVSKRLIWPVISQRADKLYAQRTALIAEAAHVVPPIGAQGLNMSLADIECLMRCSKEQGLGTREALQSYGSERLKDIKLRIRGIDVLNRMSQSDLAFAHQLRARGLKVLHQVPPVRNYLMRLGLGK